MKEIKNSFRSTYGLDAGGGSLINVATTDKTKLTDGINVEFFIRETTIQEYDPSRGYDKGFVVKYKDKLYVAKHKTKDPVGQFNYSDWNQIRTDQQTTIVKSGSKEAPYNLAPGDYVSVDSTNNEVYLKLPETPAIGDTVTIQDVGGVPGINKISITNNKFPVRFESRLVQSELLLTIPYSTLVYSFIDGTWIVFRDSTAEFEHYTDGSLVYQAQSGSNVYGSTSSKSFGVTLPVHAISGDRVYVQDFGNKNSKNPIKVSLHEKATGTISGVTGRTLESYSNSIGFVFNERLNRWDVIDSDIRERSEVVTNNKDLLPFDDVIVYGPDYKIEKTITLTLPDGGSPGNHVYISTQYLRKGQNVIIKPLSETATIKYNQKFIDFRKHSDKISTQAEFSSTKSLTFNGSSSTLGSLKFVFVSGNWVVSEFIPVIERVDSAARERLGVIALATQEQANVDKSLKPNNEVAITPETLANRTATEERQGILRTAKLTEIQIDSTATHDNLIAVTPYMLNKRTPTEKRSGVVIVATQSEVNGSTNDDKFVTPKKLHNRTATESRTGIAALTKSGGVGPISRGLPGTMVYDYNDHKTIVTPKALSELKSTYFIPGIIGLANESEVISGETQDPVKMPVAVTPEELHKKTATEGRIGFTQTASQTEVNSGANHFKYVTPKTLHNRTATTSRTGISKLATQTEFDAGNSSTISTPSVIKSRFSSSDRYYGNEDSGIVITGSIWDKLSFTIHQATLDQSGTSKTASGVETNARTIDNKVVTPKSLASVIASELNTGFSRFSTQAELVAGKLNDVGISPKNLFDLKNHTTNWKSTETVPGFIRIGTQTETFVGTQESGSTNEVSSYSGALGVSPKNLNFALTHYLPKKAQAVDSNRFDGKLSSAYAQKAEDAIISGKWTFNNTQTFKDGIVAQNKSEFHEVTLTGTSPQLTIKPSSSVTESVISLSGTGSSNWDIKTDNGDLSVLKNSKKYLGIGDTQVSVEGKKLVNVNGVDSTNYAVGGLDAISSSGSTIVIGNKTNQLKLEAPNAKEITVSDSSGDYKVLTSKNSLDLLKNEFLPLTGGTLSGRLDSNSPVAPIVKEASPESIIGLTGLYLHNISSKALYEQYPISDGTKVVDDLMETHYEDVSYSPGTLIGLVSSKTSGLQLWAPNGSNKKYIRSASSSGEWAKDFDEIYTTNNKPTPEEIGAISASGLVYKDLKVEGWIQIGNLRIRPNPETKSVDFLWVEDK